MRFLAQLVKFPFPPSSHLTTFIRISMTVTLTNPHSSQIIWHFVTSLLKKFFLEFEKTSRTTTMSNWNIITKYITCTPSSELGEANESQSLVTFESCNHALKTWSIRIMEVFTGTCTHLTEASAEIRTPTSAFQFGPCELELNTTEHTRFAYEDENFFQAHANAFIVIRLLITFSRVNCDVTPTFEFNF